MTVHETEWHLSVADITNGGGHCVVTLKSGKELKGWPNRKLSMGPSLHLQLDRHGQSGWVVIDYDEIAALAGMR
jgi:hypothetical protein